MIFDVIGDLLADRRQLKQFGFNDRVVGLLGQCFPVSDTWPLDLADSQANPCPTIPMS
jgi:hypothetical protein